MNQDNTVFDLNGEDDRGLLIGTKLLMPLWAFSFLQFPFFSIVGLLGFYNLARLTRNKLIFEANSIKLPGVLGSNLNFETITRVGFVRETGKLTFHYGDEARAESFGIRFINKLEARQLWKLLAGKLKTAEIDENVRENLLHWKGDGKFYFLATESTSPNSDSSTLTLELAQRDFSKRIETYLNTSAEIMLNCWTLTWLAALVFIGAGYLSLFMHFKLPFAIGGLFWVPLEVSGALAFGCYTACNLLFSNIFATLALIPLSLFFLKLVWKKPRADSISFGTRSLQIFKTGAFGNIVTNEILVEEMSSISVTRTQSNRTKHTIIRFLAEKNREYNLPLSALSNPGKKKQFLEILESLPIDVDSKLIEMLRPADSTSYTELWLNSLQTAGVLEQLVPLKSGDVVGNKYVIESQLSNGGQAVTYIASQSMGDQSVEKKVVLKEIVLPAFNEAAKKRGLERFRNSADLLESLEHKQIVKIIDRFQDGSRAFLVLELLQGENLKEHVANHGAVSESLAIRLARQMCEILNYLHCQSPPVVHQDFTAENMIINSEGTITLIDFDVAVQSNNVSNKLASGKSRYAAPEQISGSPCTQSDIYAMGATLFYLLSGVEPLALQSNSPRQLAEKISPEFDRFVSKCTEPDLLHRYQTAEQALYDLNFCLRQEGM